MTHRSYDRRGFGLLEVMLAAALLVLVVVPLLGMLQSLTKQVGMTRVRVVAHTLARAILERYRVEPVALLASRMSSAEAGAALIAADPLLTLPPGELASLAGAHGLKRTALLQTAALRQGVLTVRIDWSEDGKIRTHALTTLVVDQEVP